MELLTKLAHGLAGATRALRARLAHLVAGDALRRSEERLRSLGDNLPDSYVYQYTRDGDGSGRFLYVSAGVERVHGVRADEVQRDAAVLLRQTEPSSLAQISAAEAESSRSLADFVAEVLIRREDGERRWLRVRSRPHAGAKGTIVWDGVATDITLRKQAEADLRRERDFAHAVLESLPGVVYCYDDHLRLRRWNRNLERVTGYSADEIAGLSPLDLFDPADRSLVKARIQEVFERGESRVEAGLRSRDGTSTRYQLTGIRTEIDGVPHLVGVGIDSSDQRAAEAALRVTEGRYRTIFESLHDIFYRVTMEGVIETVSPSVFRLAGFRPEELVGRDVATLYAQPELREAFVAHMLAVGSVNDRELPLRAADGRVVDVSVTAWLVRDDAGRPVAMEGLLRDISERKRAERALRESEKRYASLFLAHPLPMWVYDLESLRFLAVNEAAVATYGWSREELLQMTLRDIRPSEEIDRLEAHVAQGRTGYQHSTGWRHRTREGRVLEVEITSHDIEWEAWKARVVIAVDVTERLRLEEDVRQAQKMEAVGRLAGGVAHDFNNILAVIFGYTEALLRQCPSGDARHRKLEQILSTAQRGADLSRQLLAFGRKQVLQPRILDVNHLLAEMEPMLRRLIGEDVRLSVTPGGELGQVRADKSQIEQVLMNLAVNSRDAMPHGGALCIETANLDLGDEQASMLSPVPPGRYVTVRVRDTGCGMDATTQARIFEPFFSTKPMGKGTGLGLSTTYGIVKQSNGFIRVDSQPGQGASFTVYLPRVDAPSETVKPRTATVVGGSERILIVEDEDLAREVLLEIVESLGYRATAVGGGEEALALPTETLDEIDLLLTDVVMPGINGRALAERLVATRPRLRVLFMSGYAAEAITERGVLAEGVAFVEKPGAFLEAVLAPKIREVLEGPSA